MEAVSGVWQVEKNLEPAMSLCKDCVGLDAARTLIADDPRLLGSSLESWLEPGLADCQEKAGAPTDAGAAQ